MGDGRESVRGWEFLSLTIWLGIILFLHKVYGAKEEGARGGYRAGRRC